MFFLGLLSTALALATLPGANGKMRPCLHCSRINICWRSQLFLTTISVLHALMECTLRPMKCAVSYSLSLISYSRICLTEGNAVKRFALFSSISVFSC